MRRAMWNWLGCRPLWLASAAFVMLNLPGTLFAPPTQGQQVAVDQAASLPLAAACDEFPGD